MDVINLRTALAGFLGPEQYRKFVHQLNRQPRLRAWQEHAIEKFLSEHPDCAPLGRDELLEAFAICELHGAELQDYSVPIFRGCVDYTSEYIKARAARFPNAKIDFWSTEGRPFEGNSITLRFCPACCEAEGRKN